MSDKRDPNSPEATGDWDDSVEKLLAEYRARELVPKEASEDVKEAIDAGEKSRALRIIVKRRRQLRREDLSKGSE
jgi:hypothetical protein